MSWDRVRRASQEMSERLRTSETEEQFQTVGTLAREVLISWAQAVYDRELHGVIEDGKEPSETDSRRMLEAYIERELQGGPNEETPFATRCVLRAQRGPVCRSAKPSWVYWHSLLVGGGG